LRLAEFIRGKPKSLEFCKFSSCHKIFALWSESLEFSILPDILLLFLSPIVICQQLPIVVINNGKAFFASIQKWSLGADWLIAAGAYPGFCSMKRLGVFLLPLDGMLVHRRSPSPGNLLGFPNNSPVPIYTPGWREAL